MKPSNKENGQNLDTEMFPLQSLDTWGSHKKKWESLDTKTWRQREILKQKEKKRSKFEYLGKPSNNKKLVKVYNFFF